MQDLSFDQLANALPEPVLVVSGEGIVLSANRAAAETLGKPAAGLTGSHLSEWTVAESSRTSLTEFLALCVRSRQPVFGGFGLRIAVGAMSSVPSVAGRCEGTLLRPRSEQHPAAILLRWRASHEISGRFVVLNEKIAALNHEILHRKQSEASLFEQREWLRVTLSSIGDAVIATDRDGKVRFLNPVAETLTGWPQEQAAGRPLVEIFKIVNEQTRLTVENPFQKVIQTGSVVGLANHTILISRDAVERPIEDSAAPILSDRGEVLGVVLVFHDVSERKAFERQREELLTAERAARANAERMNRIKDEFLATLSHELRTPLNAILGWAQLLRGPSTKREDLTHGLETIARNARVQTRLIEDLLDMSRIISGKLRLEVQRLELVPVIKAAIDSVRPAAEAKGIALVEILDPQAGDLLGDPNRLQQVVWNLLSNATKFTPKGGRVEICLERVESLVEISVSDTGSGIGAEFLPHLFERFRQADSSSTRHHGGLGLGLSIVKHLVELHGGSVAASSPGEGKGARFTVRLPISAVRREPSSVSEDLSAADAGAMCDGISLQGVRVLVVDDEMDARLLVKRLLEDCGAIVWTAGSTAEALGLFTSDRPDLILSDIGLPGSDGYQFIRSVRQTETAKGRLTPAVALTAFARSEDRAQALLSGYQAHLAKPVEARELLLVVASLTGRFVPQT